ncbi:unnamed protein product [Rhodiola kirilowii]
MSHAGSVVGDNSQNNEVEQVQNGEIRGAIPVQVQQQQNQPQPQYPQYPQYPPPYQQYPPPLYPQYPQPPYPQYPPPYPQLPYYPQHPPPQRPPRQQVVRDDDEDEYEGPTMGELSVSSFRDQSWPIYEGPDIAAITVNTSVVHHLPKFSGMKGESPTSHLTRFHGICLNLRPHGVEVDDFKLKAFYFSLQDAASDWFLALPSGSVHTWEQMQKQFVSKYYPAERAAQVRRQLQELRQGPHETMYEYVEKFLALEKSCCNLELPEKLIVEYMLDGLRRMDRKLLEASAGGQLMNMTPAKLKEMRELMKHVVRRQSVQDKPCEFCTSTDHKTDECPTLQTDVQADVNAVGNYQNYGNQPGPVKQYGATAPNQGTWRNNTQQHQPARPNVPHQNYQNYQTQQPYRHPHSQYQQNASGQYQQKGPNNNQAGPSNHGSNKSMEEMMKELSMTVTQYMAKTDGAITDLQKQMSQVSTAVSRLEDNAGRLPSQTIQNPKGNVSMVGVVDTTPKQSTYWEDEMLGTMGRDSTEESSPQPTGPAEALTPMEPGRILVARPMQSDPLMRQPLSTGHETPSEKSKDPGAFTVTCGIGETQIPHCLIDLGAAINVMPYSLYCSLKLGSLKPPRLMIELGDRSCTRPDGLLENLTLREGDLLVPADFYVLQMGDSRNDVPPALILGRPFLFSTKTRIDMGTGLLSLAFGGKTEDFYIYGDDDRPCARKPPYIVHTSDFDALVPDLPDQVIHTTGPAAMAKRSSPSREYVKKKPPDHWRAGSSEQLEEHVGRTEGEAEKKYDLTHPWDPNL